MEKEVVKKIVPESRVPKTVGFLGLNRGAWLQRVTDHIKVDPEGVAYISGLTNLADFTNPMKQPMNNSTLGYIYKDLEGRLILTVYFLGTEETFKATKYQRATQELIVGRDALLPFWSYQEFFMKGDSLEFEEPGEDTIQPKPRPKKAAPAGGSSTYISRFP